MFSIVFSSSFLKFKNDKVYLLNKYNLNIDNYDEETYFIDFNEINNEDILYIDNMKYQYKILLNEDNKNLLVKLDIENNLDETEFKKIMYCVEQHISCYENINSIYSNLEDDTLKQYSSKYIRI